MEIASIVIHWICFHLRKQQNSLRIPLRFFFLNLGALSAIGLSQKTGGGFSGKTGKGVT